MQHTIRATYVRALWLALIPFGVLGVPADFECAWRHAAAGFATLLQPGMSVSNTHSLHQSLNSPFFGKLAAALPPHLPPSRVARQWIADARTCRRPGPLRTRPRTRRCRSAPTTCLQGADTAVTRAPGPRRRRFAHWREESRPTPLLADHVRKC